MCSCSIENSSASDEVLKAVESALQKFPFSYQGARILSGQEEGAFGWVTVNYLDDRLTQVSAHMFGCILCMLVFPLWDVLSVCQSEMWICECLLCTNFNAFCLCCRAWTPQVLLTLEGPPLRSALCLRNLTVQSHQATPWPSDSMEMIITCTLTASCVTGKTKHYEWHWHNRLR